uniref:Nucleoprotein TPR n=1 Tax=Panagrolaimus sp. ES5 TaxID=591445 RepID=A0AC34F712_9BILA
MFLKSIYEKLLIKGLHIKIKCLEEERAELLKRIQKHENHEFQPQSLEDLRRFDANRQVVYYSTSSLPPFVHDQQQHVQPQHHVAAVDNNTFVQEQTQKENQLQQQQQLYELQQQLDTVTAEKQKLETELAAFKTSSKNDAQGFLNLLHAVEDIASAPVFEDRRSEEVEAGINFEELQRLEDENEQLRIKNSSLADNLQQFREKVTEMEAVAQDANQVQNLLESQKATIEKECNELKRKLSKNDEMLEHVQTKEAEAKLKAEMEKLEKENTTLTEAKNHLERKVKSLQQKLEEVQTEKTLLESKIYGLEKQNIGLAESNEKMSKFESENNRLDELVASLKTQVEQFQVEAELSRTCLDDMRRLVTRATNKSISTSGVQRIPSIDEAMTMKTALEALNASLKIEQNSYQQQQSSSAVSSSRQSRDNNENEEEEEDEGQQQQEQQQQLHQSLISGSNATEEQQQSDSAKYVQMSKAPVHLASSLSPQGYPEASAPIESPIQPQYYQQQANIESSNPYIQSHINSFGYQQHPPLTTQVFHSQSATTDYQHDQSYYQQLAQQTDNSYLQQQHQHENNQPPSETETSQKLEETITQLKDLQLQYTKLQTSYRELQLYYEQRERDLLEQKEHFEHRATNLSAQLSKAEEKIEESFKENVELQNDNFSVKEQVKNMENVLKQLEETKTKLGSNEEELCHLRKQMENTDNDYNHLKDTNKRLEGFLNEARTSLGEAEETRNALGSENRQLRETLESLQKALNEAQEESRMDNQEQFLSGKAYEETNRELEIENSQLRAQLSAALNSINDNTESVVNSTLRNLENNFDDSRPKTFEVETQCQLQDEMALDTVTDLKLAEEPQLSEMLKDYVKETTKFNDYLSQDVESIFVLNEELANAADTLRGQVWALNQQLKKSMLDRQEILEQIESLETQNLNTSNENLRLKQELAEQQEKLEAIQNQSNKWKNELSILYDKKAEVDAAYNQLSENYSHLQEAYSSILQKLSIPKIDGSTDPLIESDVIDSAEAIKNEYTKLEKTSAQMRAELKIRSERIRNLEKQITLGITVSSRQPLQNTDQNEEVEQARGEKATAHWTMLEIKKLLVEAADTLQRLPIDEAYEHVRRETEVKWSERVHKAIDFCENVIQEMQKCDEEGSECIINFKVPEDSENVGIESVILRLHERWRLKHHQLLESSNILQNQQQICRELESRLSDAHEKLAELESQRSSESPTESEAAYPSPASSTTTILSQSQTEFWNRLVESFSQSLRKTESIDMRLKSTNSLIHNALKQLDTSSTDANKAMVSAKLQFAILAARLTAKQADNDALFRSTAELAHTNVALQNEIDDLQEKLELNKIEETAEEVKPEKMQEIPELQISVDASFKKTRQGAKTRTIVADKPKIHENVEASVITPSKPKPSAPFESPLQEEKDSWGWNEEVTDKNDQQQKVTESEAFDDWGWNEKEVSEQPVAEFIPPPQTEETTAPRKEKVKSDAKTSSIIEPTISHPTEMPKPAKTSTAKKQIPKIKEPESAPKVEEPTATEDWRWNDEEPSITKPSKTKKSSKASTREATPSSLSPSHPPLPAADYSSSNTEWGWGDETTTVENETDSKVSEWAWNDEHVVEIPKRSVSRASSTTSKTSKTSTKKSAPIYKKPLPPPPPRSDDWGWGDEATDDVEEKEEPVKPKQKQTKSKKVESKPKSDDWGWGDEKQEEESKEATDDWGW